ncbi:MAG: replication-associated recombination protein A [Desulfobacterales bacterium]
MDLFDYQAKEAMNASRPLADRMRPTSLDEVVGQSHVLGKGGLIRDAVFRDRLFSMILWGPPGCGKTTIAGIIARETKSYFVQFSAVLSGVKDIRAVIEQAKEQLRINRKKTILFVDEIHRFNKAQQDAFLHHVESGLITLIGATTENPSFEVIPALMSRCRVITLNRLSEDDIRMVLDRAVSDTENGLGKYPVHLDKEAASFLARLADGDARYALTALEIAASMKVSARKEDAQSPAAITLDVISNALQKKALVYDKSGEEHYNLISAFHKSLRGSDPDAALYWLERMLSGGEDPMYILRRMVRFASEDIGNADPNALSAAVHAMEAFRFLGRPEGDLAISQAAVYLATAPKSNSIYAASNAVKHLIEKTGTLPTPLHIRNAPTRLMKKLGYGKGYQYAHDAPDAYIPQDYLPEKLEGTRVYSPTDRGYEKTIKLRLEKWRQLKAAKRKKNDRQAGE